MVANKKFYILEGGIFSTIGSTHKWSLLSQNRKPFTSISLKIIKQVGPTQESNSILKCILGPKRVSVQKIVGSKKR